MWGVTYDGEVTTDGTGGGSQGVGGTEENTAGLDGVLALPDHGADRAAQHVWSCVNGMRFVERCGATDRRRDP